MFWRFGFHNPSAIDTLLDREDITLEDLMDEEDLLQEAKSHNQKLIEYLCKPHNISKLLGYITATHLEEGQRFKYPFLACEIIACEIPLIIDTIVIEHKELLEELWSFLDRPASPRRKIVPKSDQASAKETELVGLDSLKASYFCKVITVLLTKQTQEMVEFIRSKPDNLSKILAHLQTSAIMDLLLTLVHLEELPEAKGIVQWLSDQGLLDDLVDRLNPYLDSEEHSIAQQCICEIIRMSQTSLAESPSIGVNDLIIELKSERMMKKLVKFMLNPDAPNSTSTLINGVTIIIDLIRHNNSDMDNDPMANGNYGYQANASLRHPTVSLADMLRVLADHVGEFNNLLLKPKSVTGPMKTSIGEQMPLGFERLKICELFAELIHCSNMSNLNSSSEDETTNQDSFASKEQSPSPSPVRLTAKDIEQAKLEPIGDYLKVKFVEHKVMPTCTDLFFSFPWNNFLHYVIYDMLHQVFNGRMDKGYNRTLAISIFKDGRLTDRMVQVQKENDEACAKPKGMRLGFMGHLTFIADEIIKLFEGYPETIVAEIKSDVNMDMWQNYCNNELKETKERDRLPLGGARPNDGIEAGMSEDDEDEDVLDGTAASQYSRYLAQRGGEDTVDDDDEEEEDDEEEHENWITGRDDYDRDYGYGGGFGITNENEPPTRTRTLHGDEEEYGSDEEEDGGRGADWSGGLSEFPQINMLHRTQSHAREGELPTQVTVEGAATTPAKVEATVEKTEPSLVPNAKETQVQPGKAAQPKTEVPSPMSAAQTETKPTTTSTSTSNSTSNSTSITSAPTAVAANNFNSNASAADDGEAEDDPFGDFTSSDSKEDDIQWTSFSDKFESMEITASETAVPSAKKDQPKTEPSNEAK
ncbi:SIT4 phosphatase-associated protein-domain-containing protein [Phycomyces nitens]|nr:SIT4 phosphatase-associated protein-domain-containing protein [Phycomyces nitens]